MSNIDYDFTLTFALPDPNIDPACYVEALGEAGCDDALIGTGQRGRIALHFNREAPDAYTALSSAIRDVKQAIPQARLLEATPDLVGTSDIAELMGFSRQNMRKLIQTHYDTFPDPVHQGSTALWHLANVLQWFEQQGRSIDPAIKDTTFVAMQINLAKALQHFAGILPDQYRRLVS